MARRFIIILAGLALAASDPCPGAWAYGPPKQAAASDLPNLAEPPVPDEPPALSGRGPAGGVDPAGSVDALPAPAEPAEPAVPGGRPAPLDSAVERAADVSAAGGSVPGEGGPGGGSPLLDAGRLGPGPQTTGLTVQVKAPSTVNLDIPATVVITIQNTGKAEAAGVEVYYPVPEGVEVVSSQPEAGKPVGGRLTWSLGFLSPGGSREFKVQIRPTKVQLIDHIATYSLQGGARAKMVVHQPKLKVEQTAFPERAVLKGKPVTFQISVTNTGSGPARNVFVQAKLSPGLRHQQDSNTIELDVGTIDPGQTVALSPLEVDAVAGGVQECEVSASSPDVAKAAEEAHAVNKVTIVEPKLKMTLVGHKTRITNTQASYRLTVENPGTAPAKNVKVTAFLPLNGKLYQPKGAEFDSRSRQLTWTVGLLDPQGAKSLDFKVQMGGVGRYQVDAEARAGLLAAKDSCATDVTAIADVNFDVRERTRAIDVGEETEFEIQVQNTGSKAATNLLFNAKITDSLEYVGTDPPGERERSDATVMRFPVIPRLEAGKKMLLTIRVKALKAGIASCRVSLVHEESGNQSLNRDAPVNVMEPRP